MYVWDTDVHHGYAENRLTNPNIVIYNLKHKQIQDWKCNKVIDTVIINIISRITHSQSNCWLQQFYTTQKFIQYDS